MADFKFGIWDCFGNFSVCLMTYFCGCITVGKNAEAVGAGSCVPCAIAAFVPGLNIFAHYKIRKTAREKVGAEGSMMTDCFYGVCCALCSHVQINREFVAGAMAEQIIERT